MCLEMIIYNIDLKIYISGELNNIYLKGSLVQGRNLLWGGGLWVYGIIQFIS